MQEIISLFENKIFNCNKCKDNKSSIKLMNPYSDVNKKVKVEKPTNYLNRRKFIMEYTKAKSEIKVMIIGLAPGLDGCGFSGVPFTSEKNAILDLQIENYHHSSFPYQKEPSAELIYNALNKVASKKGVTVKDISRYIYMTNICQCVPLGDTETSIQDPSAEMINNCWTYLYYSIVKIKPETIIVLGTKAYDKIMKHLGGKAAKDIRNLTDCVRNQEVFNIDSFKVIPEIHPSPQNLRNSKTRCLYQGLEERLVKYIYDSM